MAAPLAGAAQASGDDLLDGVALALMELDGRVLVLEAQADPAAIQEARDAWQSGLPTRPGNATCRLVDADGAAGDPYPCDLQAVKDLGGAGLPDDGATLDAGALVRRDDAAGQAAVGVRITVWVEGWGIRVCGSVDF